MIFSFYKLLGRGRFGQIALSQGRTSAAQTVIDTNTPAKEALPLEDRPSTCACNGTQRRVSKPGDQMFPSVLFGRLLIHDTDPFLLGA